MSMKEHYLKTEGLSHQRHDSKQSVEDGKSKPRSSPSPERGSEVQPAPPHDSRTDTIRPLDNDPRKCLMFIREKQCESGGVVVLDGSEGPFCQDCLDLPTAILLHRAEEDNVLRKEIFDIHKELALQVPICLGNDFGNRLNRPKFELWWRKDLKKKKIEWMQQGENFDINLLRCLAVPSNYHICQRCASLMSSRPRGQEFRNTFRNQGNWGPYGYPYVCLLEEILNPAAPEPPERSSWEPEAEVQIPSERETPSIPSWLTDTQVEEIRRLNYHTHVNAPDSFCQRCVLTYDFNDKEEFRQNYNTFGYIRSDAFNCITWHPRQFPGPNFLGPQPGGLPENMRNLQLNSG